MRNAVVGFSGGIASGKSSLSTALSQALGWPLASFGAYVRSVAVRRGLERTRENLQKLGEELVDGDVRKFCDDVLGEASWRPGMPLLIDGIRHAHVADILVASVRPSDFILVFVDLPGDQRDSRLRIRDPESQPLACVERHSTEAQLAEIRARADLILDGDRPLGQLVEEVARFLVPRQGDSGWGEGDRSTHPPHLSDDDPRPLPHGPGRRS